MPGPVSLDKLLVDKELLKHVKVLAAIDRGCSLTKILYVSKNSTDASKYELNFALFKNSDFEEGLEWMKKEALLPSDGGKLHITGIGCDLYKDTIKEKIGLELEFVDEFVTQNQGAYFLIKNLEDKEFTYKMSGSAPTFQQQVDQGEAVIPELHMKVMEAFMKELSRNVIPGKKFPALLSFIGSGCGVLQLNEDGSTTMVGGTMLAGKSFLGLSKLLLGTGNYDEIIALAEKGNRGNVDTVIGEITTGDPNSPYGKLPPHIPLFTMGKVYDEDKTLDSFKKEDLAHSVIGCILNSITPVLADACMRTGINTVYIGGNFVRSELVRNELLAVSQMPIAGLGMIKYNFINTGHTGAIGAMLTSAEGVDKLVRTDIK